MFIVEDHFGLVRSSNRCVSFIDIPCLESLDVLKRENSNEQSLRVIDGNDVDPTLHPQEID